MSDEGMTMPSWRFGRRCRMYSNEKTPRFHPAHRLGSDIFFDAFDDVYYARRKDALAALAKMKAKYEEKAKAGEKYIAETDPEMAERMFRHMCTQEDCRKPHYEKIADAVRAVRGWNTVKDWHVGRWSEPPDVFRLNTMPYDKGEAGKRMLSEITEKLRWFGYVTIGWSCLGHTRARWQTAAVADWARKEYGDCLVEEFDDTCTITWADK